MKPTSIQLIRYDSEHKETWDNAVGAMKNATFLHLRDFMDYHADRFIDASLLFAKANKIIAVWPANYCERTQCIYTHQGLTYGGLLLLPAIHYADVEEIMSLLIAYYKHHYPRLQEIIIKPAPYIYQTHPSDELLYWLHTTGGVLQARTLSSCITLGSHQGYSQLRKRKLRKAKQQPWEIIELASQTSSALPYLAEYWRLLTDTLNSQHGVAPVHSLEEITMLWQKFPQNIKVALVMHREHHSVVAGTVLFDTVNVRHTQYIANSAEGRADGALELLFDHLIQQSNHTHSYFDFGISTEQGGRILNEGLLFQKEGFGARGVCYDTYKLSV